MPVLINSGSSIDASRASYKAWDRRLHGNEANCLDIALVNNVPEAGRRATERQYLRVLTAASDHFILRIKFYSIFEVPQDTYPDSNTITYHKISDLWDSHHDALIMTGTEPKTLDITKEHYWPILIQTIDWCQMNVISAIWSCLTAHAAVRYLDGIQRRPLERKCFGIFPCDLLVEHPLLDGISFPLWVQHSRWNAIDAKPLADADYTVLTGSRIAGADIFIKRRKCLSLFFQGHPEYAADTLLREYRRDVARYLNHESDTYPLLPENCVDDDGAAALLEFRERTMVQRDSKLISKLCLPAGQEITHRSSALAYKLYRNWLSMLAARKTRRPPAIHVGELRIAG
jgi:homoserine O-succinyltransferase